jgi:hypothetical protein
MTDAEIEALANEIKGVASSMTAGFGSYEPTMRALARWAARKMVEAQLAEVRWAHNEGVGSECPWCAYPEDGACPMLDRIDALRAELDAKEE